MQSQNHVHYFGPLCVQEGSKQMRSGLVYRIIFLGFGPRVAFSLPKQGDEGV